MQDRKYLRRHDESGTTESNVLSSFDSAEDDFLLARKIQVWDSTTSQP